MVSGGWATCLSSRQTLSMPLPLTAPPGSISPAVGGRVQGWLEGGRGGLFVVRRLLFSSPLLLSLYLPPPLPAHFQLTHGSSRSHHLTTPPTPTHHHLLPHDKHAHAAITPQENTLASSGCTTHLIIYGKQMPLSCSQTDLMHQNKSLLGYLPHNRTRLLEPK